MRLVRRITRRARRTSCWRRWGQIAPPASSAAGQSVSPPSSRESAATRTDCLSRKASTVPTDTALLLRTATHRRRAALTTAGKRDPARPPGGRRTQAGGRARRRPPACGCHTALREASSGRCGCGGGCGGGHGVGMERQSWTDPPPGRPRRGEGAARCCWRSSAAVGCRSAGRGRPRSAAPRRAASELAQSSSHVLAPFKMT
jgi:hypothetical protein